MTNEEFSNQLDTLLNSYNIQAGFGEGSNKQGGIALDEYEKSVLLTQAQDIIVKSYFDKTLNQQGQGFDDSPRRQVDFSSLIKVAKYNREDTTHNYLKHDDDKCYDDRGLLVDLGIDKKILFILNERLEVTTGSSKKIYVVVPINYREYDREMSKAYAQPLKKQAWRLFSNAATGYDIQSEIIPIYGSLQAGEPYYMQYREIPNSIVPETVQLVKQWIKLPNNPDNYNYKGEVETEADLPLTPSVGDIYKIDNISSNIKYTIRYVQRPAPIVLREPFLMDYLLMV